MAQAINEALELLVETKEGTVTPGGTFGTNGDARKKGTKAYNANLDTSNDADGNYRDPNGTTELKSRLTDAMAQVEFLKGQIAMKDNQIAIKDQQIDKQAFSLQ